MPYITLLFVILLLWRGSPALAGSASPRTILSFLKNHAKKDAQPFSNIETIDTGPAPTRYVDQPPLLRLGPPAIPIYDADDFSFGSPVALTSIAVIGFFIMNHLMG